MAPNNTFSTIVAEKNLPEITFKAVILAVLLACILGAANAYLGLKVGMTISASIPAAVVSMGILRLFKNSNILENNIVQTAASASEALVAGIIFVLPALLILHVWGGFPYWETTVIAIIGGILGVFFSIPLRRILLADTHLRFPEGVAIAQVLSISNKQEGGSLKLLIQSSIVGGLISFAQSGLQIIADTAHYWAKAGTKFAYGILMGFEPATLAAGYIVGTNTGISSLVGIFIGWFLGIPVLSYLNGFNPADSATHIAMHVWQSQVRYIGVGTMLIGGLWTLLTLLRPIAQGIKSSLESVQNMKQSGGMRNITRTERDIPINYVFFGVILLLIPMGFLFHHFIQQQHATYSTTFELAIFVLAILFVPIIGFILSSVCGYFAGLVGSSNNPISGMALAALLLASLLLLGIYTLQPHTGNTTQMLSLASLAVIITTVTTCAAAITNDTIQDLKTGQLVGATPWKQQVMLIIGAIASSFVIPPILSLLFNAYGIGGVFPHPGMDPTQMLAAPQAALMATLTRAVFEHNLPWGMILTGCGIAVITILIDNYLKTKGTRLPVLAVGFGIYLPTSVTLSVVTGGIASYFIKRSAQKRALAEGKKPEEAAQAGNQRGGLIIACGLVAGSALMGVILAIPFTLAQSTDILKVVGDSFSPIATILGCISVLGLLSWIYRVVNHEPKL